MSEQKSNDSYQYENIFEAKSGEEKKNTYAFYCNVWSCRQCHSEQTRLTPEEIENIKRKKKNSGGYPKPKRCDGNCNFCYNKISSMQNYY